MKSIIFIIHTEQHLLFSLKVILSYHKIRRDNIVIYRIAPDYTRRLNMKLNFEDTGIKYRTLFFRNKRFSDTDIRNKLIDLFAEKTDVLYLFNEDSILLPYIVRKFKKRNTRIVLCPDGTKPYGYNVSLKDRFFFFLFSNLYYFSNRIPFFLNLYSKHYAHNKDVDAVIVDNSEAYVNYTHKDVLELEAPIHDEYVKLADHVFLFNPKSFTIIDGSVLWIDQPIPEIREEKRKFLDYLHNKYPSKKIYIKPHPFSDANEIKSYENIDGYEIVRLDLPFELLVENLNRVNILSSFSAALLCNNPQCKYYWVYPIFSSDRFQIDEIPPLPHIEILNDIKQIELY